MFVITVNIMKRPVYCVLAFQNTGSFYRIQLTHCSYLGDEVHFRSVNTGIQNKAQTIAPNKWLIIIVTFDKGRAVT
jgi:hypothetical protein